MTPGGHLGPPHGFDRLFVSLGAASLAGAEVAWVNFLLDAGTPPDRNYGAGQAAC
ncbi:DUF6112 family protein [Microbacterium saperdae]|uniref:DUF6112 family protein n=1 Tax=Microbacterium saperdae TaxID=69368 RepID=UPI0038996B69